MLVVRVFLIRRHRNRDVELSHITTKLECLRISSLWECLEL
nr:MAG TPA: hypothetical protein [Caudoviricetes sp.]